MVGIPESQFEAIFDSFIQSGHSRSFGNHSGLGLSISRQIAEAHQGHFLLKINQWWCNFTLILPLSAEEISNGDA